MNDNSLINEIRNVRELHAKGLDFNLHAIAKDIRNTEEQLRQQGWTIVRREPKAWPANTVKQTASK